MILAKVANTNHNDVICTLLLIGWLAAGLLALISLLRPIVDTVMALLVAGALLVAWAVIC